MSLQQKERHGGGDLSRRRLLKVGLSAAAIAAMGKSGQASAEAQAEKKAASKQAFRAAGVRPIDIHAHYFPQSFLDVLGEDGKRFNAEYRLTDQGLFFKSPGGSSSEPLAIKIVDLKQRIATMDDQGVAVQVMSLTAPMANWGDEELSHKLAQAWNDGASAAHQAYPDRLFAFLTLPMLYPDRAADEIQRASKLPGIRGVYMGTNIDGRDLDDPLFEPTWARIEALGLPVFLHPIKTVGGDRVKPWYLSNLIGNPVDTAIAACHLIFGGVIDHHPKLQITLPHAGGALPFLIGRIDHGWTARAEIKALHMPNPPSSYLPKFRYDTIVHSKQAMEYVLQQVGAERVMLGSDFCFEMGYDRPIEFLDKINLTSAQRKMILGGNAAGLLKV